MPPIHESNREVNMKMGRELINANISHVSYVDKAANKKQFFLTKSADQPNIQKQVNLFINKAEEAKQLVYGLVYEPDVKDAHGDFMKAEEIEKAAHQFLKDARNIDQQHDFEAGVGEVVESYIAPSDFAIGDQIVTKGSWVLATKASDAIWESIQKGEITGYSMAGHAEAIEEPIAKAEPSDEAQGFFNLVKNFFTKGAVKDNYDKRKPARNVGSALDSFCEEIWNAKGYDSVDFTKVYGAIDDFTTIIKEIQGAGLDYTLKAFEKEGDEIEMKKEELESIIKSAVNESVAPINERLDSLEKAEKNDDELSDADKKKKKDAEAKADIKKDDFAEIIKSAIDDAVKPLNERLETVEKTRTGSNLGDTDSTKIEKEASVWDGLL